jgi:hypothetical protein
MTRCASERASTDEHVPCRCIRHDSDLKDDSQVVVCDFETNICDLEANVYMYR